MVSACNQENTHPFQFHKGTIRTNVGGKPLAHFFCYFNSIKVQLEHYEVCQLLHRLGYFNSIKVQLEPIFVPYFDLYFFNFNSIKVQLEQVAECSNRTVSTFQFHKGTIRTHLPMYRCFPSGEFQFHKGTIRTPSSNARKKAI